MAAVRQAAAGRFMLLPPWPMQMLAGALIAMAGNFIYACVVVANRWWVILIAR